jgi:hypothetical protein
VTEGFTHISLPLPEAEAHVPQGSHSVAAVLDAHLRCGAALAGVACARTRHLAHLSAGTFKPPCSATCLRT